MNATLLANITAVAVGGRVLLIEGPPGAGKSSLALSLIDRGATLVGDDAIALHPRGPCLVAAPPPNTAGLIEVRNVGLVVRPVCEGPVSLVLALDPAAERFPLAIETRQIEGYAIPVLRFAAGDSVEALRAEYALVEHGLPLPELNERA